MLGARKGRPLKESLKLLEADLQHANTMHAVREDSFGRQRLICLLFLAFNKRALGLPREEEGACLQMRLSFGPSFLLCFFSWADCGLIGALGLLHVMIYKVLKDGTTTMSVHERKASLREFYGYILPSLQVLDGGLTEREASDQKAACREKYLKKDCENEMKVLSEVDIEREKECGICFEIVSKVVLPNCYHSLCIQCYKDWFSRSASCPFCRLSLKRVNSGDLWVLMNHDETKTALYVREENLRRLFVYVDKLPLSVCNKQYDVKKGPF